LVIDKQSAETTSGGATHKCKECSLFARFVNTPDSLIDDDSVASNAVAHLMKLDVYLKLMGPLVKN
jgi:hypothetical protein